MFGINALSQPELIQTPLVPPCLAESHVTVPVPTDHLQAVDEQLFHSCFVHPVALITQTLDKLKPKEEGREKAKEVEALGCVVEHFEFLVVLIIPVIFMCCCRLIRAVIKFESCVLHNRKFNLPVCKTERLKKSFIVSHSLRM